MNDVESVQGTPGSQLLDVAGALDADDEDDDSLTTVEISVPMIDVVLLANWLVVDAAPEVELVFARLLVVDTAIGVELGVYVYPWCLVKPFVLVHSDMASLEPST